MRPHHIMGIRVTVQLLLVSQVLLSLCCLWAILILPGVANVSIADDLRRLELWRAALGKAST